MIVSFLGPNQCSSHLNKIWVKFVSIRRYEETLKEIYQTKQRRLIFGWDHMGVSQNAEGPSFKRSTISNSNWPILISETHPHTIGR